MNRQRGGFALLDTVVGLFIAAMTVMIAHGVSETLIDATHRSEAQRTKTEEAVAIRRQIVSWLRSAVMHGDSADWTFFGVPRGGGTLDAILSVTTDAPGPFTAGEMRLTLAVDNDSTTPERGLVLYAGNPPEARIDTLATTSSDTMRVLRQLLPQASALAIRYLHSVAGEHYWTTRWVSTAELPEAIELQLIGDSIPPLLTAGIFVVPRGTSQ